MINSSFKQVKNKQKQQLLLKQISQLLCLLSPLSDSPGYHWLENLSYEAGITQLNKIFQIQYDVELERQFLKTPHNCCRDRDRYVLAYRSPYSNRYYPTVENGVFPSPLVRGLEERGRKLFQEYAKMYYCDNYIANVFIEENENQLWFAFCLQKKFKQQHCQGIWSSLNFAVITGQPKSSVKYNITTSVIYEINCTQDSDECKPFSIKGNITIKVIVLEIQREDTRKISTQIQIQQMHLNSIGRAVEQNQTHLRRKIQSVFAIKTNAIIQKTRFIEKREQLNDTMKQMKQKIRQRKVRGMIQLHN